jgi:arginine utilization regulatory protein
MKWLDLNNPTSLILDQIIQKINEGVNVVDKDGNIIYVNKNSADYAEETIENMLGEHIAEFYPNAAVLKVLNSKKEYTNIHVQNPDGRHFIVSAYPLMIDGQVKGGLSIFRDITELKMMNSKISNLQEKLINTSSSNIFNDFIGSQGSLKEIVNKACKAMGSPGGPRHSIISGETGTGKTLLAKLMYRFAKNIGVLKEDAPFIHINCAQFTNPDIAASEIFGSKKGSFTGASNKNGLIEQANKGILFLDEAHALKSYQNLLLKVIEEQTVRRIGGAKEIPVDVIIIAASTKNLEKNLLPELYQRLAQYELVLPPFDQRSYSEKEKMFLHFKEEYKRSALEKYDFDLEIMFEPEARERLLNASYKRNVRHFKSVINYSIDSATPLINSLNNKKLMIIVKNEHIPDKILDDDQKNGFQEEIKGDISNSENVEELIRFFRKKGFGARRIANRLQEKGIDLKYYQVTYRLQKMDLQ